MLPSRQQTIQGVGGHGHLTAPNGLAAPIAAKPAPAERLKGRLLVAGTFLEMLRHTDDEPGRSVFLYDDCSHCGTQTLHKFVLMRLRPRTWGRVCLEH